MLLCCYQCENEGGCVMRFLASKAKASVGCPSQKNTACFSLSNLKHQEHIVNSIINNLNSFNLTELHLDGLLSIPIVFASFWPHLARKIWKIGDVRIVFCDKFQFHVKYITPARIVCQHVQLFQHLLILFLANNKKTLVILMDCNSRSQSHEIFTRSCLNSYFWLCAWWGL